MQFPGYEPYLCRITSLYIIYTYTCLYLYIEIYTHIIIFSPMSRALSQRLSVQFSWIFTVLWWLWGNSEFGLMADPGPNPITFSECSTSIFGVGRQNLITGTWTAAGLLVAGAVTATHVLMACLHFPLSSILRLWRKAALSVLWKRSPLRSKSPIKCGFLTYKANREQDQSGTLGYPTSRNFFGSFCSWSTENISLWVRGEGKAQVRHRFPGKAPISPWSWAWLESVS